MVRGDVVDKGEEDVSESFLYSRELESALERFLRRLQGGVGVFDGISSQSMSIGFRKVSRMAWEICRDGSWEGVLRP